MTLTTVVIIVSSFYFALYSLVEVAVETFVLRWWWYKTTQENVLWDRRPQSDVMRARETDQDQRCESDIDSVITAKVIVGQVDRVDSRWTCASARVAVQSTAGSWQLASCELRVARFAALAGRFADPANVVMERACWPVGRAKTFISTSRRVRAAGRASHFATGAH